jgi:hypothetical protein
LPERIRKNFRFPAFIALLLTVLAPIAPATEAATPREQIPASAERQRAAACIDYYNHVSAALSEAPHALPGLCQAAAHEYLRDWRLKTVPGLDAAGPKELAAAAGRLAPPPKLFDGDTVAQITRNIAEMGQNLRDALKEFRRLQKYVKDDSISDDGALGKNIVSRLDAACRKFAEARDGLLKIAGESSARAEDLLLYAHPLKRQIGLAGEIFSLFRQCALLLGRDRPDEAALEQLGGKLETALTEAAKPPFRGSPDLERKYRAFLKETEIFVREFSLGLSVNFGAGVRHNLNAAIAASRAAYNNFAAAVNRQ